MGRFSHSGLLSNDQLRHLAMIMAYIVDQKSPFTTQHSTRVAGLARYLGQLAGLGAERCDQIEIAGLLHDIGKLHMPDRILEKPGPLTESERSLMNQHSFETYELLRRIDGMEEIASWAAYHHEGVNGVGYPFHPESAHLGIEARVIAVADVFQALVQNRPYRKGMPLRRVIGILEDSAREGRLDRELVALAIEHRETCFEIANGQDPRYDGNPMSLLSPGARADGQVLRALP